MNKDTKGIIDRFRLDGKTVVITGGAGLLGIQHAEAVLEAGGTPVLWDIDQRAIDRGVQHLHSFSETKALGQRVDITNENDIGQAISSLLNKVKRVDCLINNAARNPKVETSGKINTSRLEHFPIHEWIQDISVGLTGSFLCAKAVGSHMAEDNNGGVILNITSDLGVIGPDQRIYQLPGLAQDQQPTKPVTYSVVKHGLIGLTRYLATYWADRNIRINALAPGGIYTNQPPEFVKKLTNLIPIGRMASQDEYKASVLFLISEASSYMTGAVLNIDGGRTCW